MIPENKTGLPNIRESRVMAHAGFEPAISALRGRRPGPLDEWAARLRHSGADYTRIF